MLLDKPDLVKMQRQNVRVRKYFHLTNSRTQAYVTANLMKHMYTLNNRTSQFLKGCFNLLGEERAAKKCRLLFYLDERRLALSLFIGLALFLRWEERGGATSYADEMLIRQMVN